MAGHARLSGSAHRRQGREGLRALQRSGQGIDAVFCSSDMMAAGVLTEAAAQGLEVPRQLAVMGFGDMEIAASMSPASN